MSGKAFALMSLDYEDTHPIACYSDRTAAEEEGRRLEKLYKETQPAFDEWCRRRWSIVEQWRREGELESSLLSLPTEEGEAEIVRMIGPCPPLEGRECCDVWEIEDRMHVCSPAVNAP